MVLGGLIDHSHGKHLFLHPQPFWPKDANLVISTLFHHIRDRLLTNTTPNTRPSVLYLQADNCAAENKNVYMLAFLSLLVSLDVFQEVYLSFLLVRHTHEDIDQLFSTAQTKFHTSSIHTPVYVNSTQCALGFYLLTVFPMCIGFLFVDCFPDAHWVLLRHLFPFYNCACKFFSFTNLSFSFSQLSGFLEQAY